MKIHSRIARRKPLIGVENRLKRVRWCTRVRLWNADDNWSRLVFSDESKFNSDFDDGRVRVWRDNGDAMLPRNPVCLRRRSNVPVMVWGCVTVHGVGELVVVNGNINHQVYINVLDENLLQAIENILAINTHHLYPSISKRQSTKPGMLSDGWTNRKSRQSSGCPVS